MSKAKKKNADSKQRESRENRQPQAPLGGSGDTNSSLFGWIHAKRPVVGFVVLFALLIGLFYSVTFIGVMEQKILPAYMRLNAKASAAILNVFGEGATAEGTTLRSKRASVSIRHGCDAIEPSGLFLAAVLAFPAPLRTKIPGLLTGTFVLAAINLFRIVSLFYVRIYSPTWFETMHVDVWQPIFVLLALVFWILWAWWATEPIKAPAKET